MVFKTLRNSLNRALLDDQRSTEPPDLSHGGEGADQLLPAHEQGGGVGLIDLVLHGSRELCPVIHVTHYSRSLYGVDNYSILCNTKSNIV